MELYAALKVFEHIRNLPRSKNLILKTDSKYLIDGLNLWINNWKKKGWLTASKKPVLNQDLWKALDKAKLNGVHLEYVKGHSGDNDNDRVDKIAVSFSKQLTIKLRNS